MSNNDSWKTRNQHLVLLLWSMVTVTMTKNKVLVKRDGDGCWKYTRPSLSCWNWLSFCCGDLRFGQVLSRQCPLSSPCCIGTNELINEPCQALQGSLQGPLQGSFVYDDRWCRICDRLRTEKDYWGTPTTPLSLPRSHKSFRPLTVLCLTTLCLTTLSFRFVSNRFESFRYNWRIFGLLFSNND